MIWANILSVRGHVATIAKAASSVCVALSFTMSVVHLGVVGPAAGFMMPTSTYPQAATAPQNAITDT